MKAQDQRLAVVACPCQPEQAIAPKNLTGGTVICGGDVNALLSSYLNLKSILSGPVLRRDAARLSQRDEDLGVST